MTTSVRVAHVVDTYLKISENWIYPQIVRVPGINGRVVCRVVENLDAFPLSQSPILWYSPKTDPSAIDILIELSRLNVATVALRLKWWGAQILHAHFGGRAWKCLRLKQRLGIPMVTSFYGYDAWQLPVYKPFWRKRYHELFASGELFAVEGPAMRQRLIDLGCPESKIRIQRIGANLTSLQFTAPNLENAMRVALVGRFVEKKGFVDGLRACAIARSRGVSLKVTIVGDATDHNGEQIKQQLHAIANCRELAGAVDFTGFRSLEQTHSLLREHNVFLCPSRHTASGDAEGGSPIALTEAMALGLICIGTRHCDIPEVIIDGLTGYLCDERDINGMADALEAVANDVTRSQSLSVSGRKHVEQTFALDVQMRELRTLYNSLLDPHPEVVMDLKGTGPGVAFGENPVR